VLRKIRKREAFLWSFEFYEIAVQLNLVVLVLTHCKTQKYGRIARVAFVDKSNVFGFVTQQ
jgi:hypothetical protein